MYLTICLYITITILLWVLSIYPFIKHYTIVVSIITIQFSHTILLFPHLIYFGLKTVLISYCYVKSLQLE